MSKQFTLFLKSHHSSIINSKCEKEFLEIKSVYFPFLHG